MIDQTNVVYIKNESGCRDQLDWVQSVMKTKDNNNVTDHISLVYAKIETELSRPK